MPADDAGVSEQAGILRGLNRGAVRVAYIAERKMSMEKYYFGYLSSLRGVSPVKWYGDMPVHGKLIQGTKVELTETEVELPLAVLEVKYPFPEITELH